MISHRSRIPTLVLYADYADYVSQFGYYADWREAFLSHAALRADAIDVCEPDAAETLRGKIRSYELIVALHSTNADTVEPLSSVTGPLCERRGKMVVFVGNEVNLPSCPISAKLELLRRIHPEYVATQLPVKAGRFLYSGIDGAAVLEVPHALNPERYSPRIAHTERKIDVGVRSCRYFASLGDNDRNRITAYFREHASDLKIQVDIDHDNRFDRNGWADFLNRCKGTVTTEAGSYYLEKDDRTVRRIARYIDRKYNTCPQRLYGRVRRWRPVHPVGKRVKWYCKRLLRHEAREPVHYALNRGNREELVSFDEVYRRFLRDYRNPVSGKCISSRHFEAIGTKTLQIMFRGQFNGILRPDVHYLGLESDFSNIGDVMARFRDPALCQEITDTAYDLVLSNHTHAHRIDALLAAVAEN